MLTADEHQRRHKKKNIARSSLFVLVLGRRVLGLRRVYEICTILGLGKGMHDEKALHSSNVITFLDARKVDLL